MASKSRTFPWCAICALLATVALGACYTPSLPEDVTRIDSSFVSDGKEIRVERYEPKAPGHYPAIVLLHGSDGRMRMGSYRWMAGKLAEDGYAAFYIEYFDSTDSFFATSQVIDRNFRTWAATIVKGISYVSRQPEVDPNRIGLLGFSLGATLSLSESVFDPRVKAVNEYFGAYPDQLKPEIDHLPPVLILHGSADTLVSVDEAYKLRALLDSRHKVYQIHVYPGEGHGFPHYLEDAAQRSEAFFERYLKHPRVTQRGTSTSGAASQRIKESEILAHMSRY